MNELITALQPLHEKFFNLVWYARKPPLEDAQFWEALTPDIRKAAMVNVFDVESKWPEDCAKLADPESGDWEHGFNSGMLAGLRYVFTLIEAGQAQADDEFPFLDS